MSKLWLILFFVFCFSNIALAEDFALVELKGKNISKPVSNLNYNFENVQKIPIKLRITEEISTEDANLHEGQIVTFRVLNDVKYKGKTILRRNDYVNGKIKLIITSGMNGIPYSITIGDFEIPNIKPYEIFNDYRKEGFKRSYLVFPLKWMLTPLPPLGSLTNFIKGGHAKINFNTKVVIYYYPFEN